MGTHRNRIVQGLGSQQPQQVEKVCSWATITGPPGVSSHIALEESGSNGDSVEDEYDFLRSSDVETDIELWEAYVAI